MLTATDMLDLVDAGAGSTPARRALLLAAVAEGARDADALADLPVGRRNAIILEARRAALGDVIECRVPCPACGEGLEFALAVGALLAQAAPAPDEPLELALGELTIAWRPPTAGDLLAIEEAASLEAAQRELLGRCVIAAQVRGDPLTAQALPEPALAALAAAIRARDPLIETALDLRCPACDHAWQASLDIAAFVWREFVALADRIAGEVDALARAYGWSEREILTLSARRRRRYLDMIEA